MPCAKLRSLPPRTMITRAHEHFDLHPARLAADTGYGSAEMLDWRCFIDAGDSRQLRAIHPLEAILRYDAGDGAWQDVRHSRSFLYHHEKLGFKNGLFGTIMAVGIGTTAADTVGQ